MTAVTTLKSVQEDAAKQFPDTPPEELLIKFELIGEKVILTLGRVRS